VSRKSKSRALEAAAKCRPGLLRRLGREPVQTTKARPPIDRSIVCASARRWVRWLAPSLVASFTVAAFLPVLQNQFLIWDDQLNFLSNPHYRGLAWTHLCWMWTTFHMGHYIPLTWMTLGLDYWVWGMNPFGYHLTSLLLHAANAVAFYFLVLRLVTLALPDRSERDPALGFSAAFTALLFAIHPLRVESVAWITERRDVLSGLFYLLTILAYLRAHERPEHGRRWYWVSVALFACALLSKSMAVSLPVVLLIVDVYPLRRLGGSTGWWSEPARRVYREKIPFVLLGAAGVVVALQALSAVHNMASLARLSVPGRFAVSAYSLSFYLWKTVMPVNLSPLYPLPPTVNPWALPFVLASTLVLAVTALALTLRRRAPALLAAWSAHVVILLPVLGIVQNGPQIVADRYTYLAGLGWATLAGGGLLSCWRAWPTEDARPRRTFTFVGLAVGVAAGLGVLTWNQVQIWHDSERLWVYTVARHPGSSFAQFSLGEVLSEQGKPREAIEHFKKGLQLQPDEPFALTALGVALAQEGELAEAIEHFQRALRINVDVPEAHVNWGAALLHQGHPAEGIKHLQQALRIKADLPEAHVNWGAALVQQGNPAEAIEHFEQALRIRPDLPEAHRVWGVALTQHGHVAGALEQIFQALNVKPDFVEADRTLRRQDRLAEAIEHFQQALHLKPDYALVHVNWGQALIQQGKPIEAMEHFRQALRLKPDLAEAATEHYQQALRLRGRKAE